MRLEAHEIEAIRNAAREVFGDDAVVRVFGSRVDDTAKGGDLDLMIEVEPGRASLAAEFRFQELIEGPLDELRTDVVLYERGREPTLIQKVAFEDGIIL